MSKLQPNQVLLKNVRLSYPNLFTPKAVPGSDVEKYSASLIISKDDTENLEKIKAAIEAAKVNVYARKQWGEKIPSNLRTPLRDGDADRPDDEAYNNSFFLNASKNTKPQLKDAYNTDLTDETALYAGCYINVILSFFAYGGMSKGVGAGLEAVQKSKDGEPLSGSTVIAGDIFGTVDNSDDLDGLV